MQTDTRSNRNEREFLAAGDPDSTGKVRRLPVVTAQPEPHLPLGESTRVESLIFDDSGE